MGSLAAPPRSRSGSADFMAVLGVLGVIAKLLCMVRETPPAEGQLAPRCPLVHVRRSCRQAKTFARALSIGIYRHGGVRLGLLPIPPLCPVSDERSTEFPYEGSREKPSAQDFTLKKPCGGPRPAVAGSS